MNKQDFREHVWGDLEESGIARFPFPPHGRIPNFVGAKTAADRLAETAEWANADSVKANPDAPQLPVRRRALREGKVVYMSVPRLREEECFFRLDPDTIESENLDTAPTVSSAGEYAEHVGPDAVDSIDLVVSGSVAVSENGARIGKGEGYSDLEFAILSDLGLVDESVPVATTVHERQVFADSLPSDEHDVPMDLVVTPERTIRPDSRLSRPGGVDWDELTAERIDEIPVLDRLRTGE